MLRVLSNAQYDDMNSTLKCCHVMCEHLIGRSHYGINLGVRRLCGIAYFLGHWQVALSLELLALDLDGR